MVFLEDLSSVMTLKCKFFLFFLHPMLVNNDLLFYFQFRNPAMIAIFRKREQKWLNMLDDWEKYMTYKYKKV